MDISNTKLKFNKKIDNIQSIYKSLSPERVILFWAFLIISILLIFSAIIVFNSRFLITVPAYGGKIREGIVGTPRFINPVLANSEQDKDLTILVYAGLTKKDALGQIIFDMAEKITKSDDNLKYEVTLKNTATFHDGTKVTSDDIIYTISLIQNPSIKSPHRIEWEGVDIEKISDTELLFSLKKPFPLFMNILTIGILPKNIWKNLSEEQFSLSDYNIRAVGSGPYKIKEIKTKSGIPTTFMLESHSKYTLGRPYINSITIETYQNEKYSLQGFSNGDIDRIHGITPDKIKNLNIATDNVETSLLPRTFTIFFNPNKAKILSNKNIRSALSMAIDKVEIVNEVLLGYGETTNTPYPFDEDNLSQIYDIDKARSIIENSSEIKKEASSTLSIILTTANTDEMKRTAEIIKKSWEQIGVNTTILVYEVSDLNQSVIKERDFEALLFGSITQNPSDLYAFWHSSQRSYPGLNISNYVSKKLDTNLETLRNSEDGIARISAYDAVKKEFEEESPGIFLFAPSLIYITNDKTKTFLPKYSFDSSSRFSLVHEWYQYKERIWPKTYSKKILEKLQNIIY